MHSATNRESCRQSGACNCFRRQVRCLRSLAGATCTRRRRIIACRAASCRSSIPRRAAACGVTPHGQRSGLPATRPPIGGPHVRRTSGVDACRPAVSRDRHRRHHGGLYIADGQGRRVRKVSVSGIITTIAGNGQAGSSGDGGRATDARLQYPTAIAIDLAGNVYIADSHRVRQISSDGVITSIAGSGERGYSGDGGPAARAQLNGPLGLVVDGRGVVYVSDTGNGIIRTLKVR